MKNTSVFQGLLIILALGLFPVAPISYAQDLLPELAGPAAKHKATNEALDKQKLEAVALATKPYLSALDSLEKSATAKGELDVVAAVVKEREAAAAGALDPEMPTTLPKMKLQGTRKALLTKLEQINADFAKRKKQSDADYLRLLASLQAKASTNPELAKQLAAEKAALLASASVAISGNTAQNGKKPGKNVIINGDFEKVVDGKPDAWQRTENATVLKENNNSFIRIEGAPNNDGTASFRYIEQTHEVSPKSKSVIITARIRTSNITVTKNSKGAGIYPFARLTFFDDKEKKLMGCEARWGGQNGGWKEIQNESLIPAGTCSFQVALSNGYCSGPIDFDDVEVTFK